MYERPNVTKLDETAEGVYAASGSGDCWTVDIKTTQDWNGSAHVFEVHAIHSRGVGHGSNSATAVFTFNNVVTSCHAENNTNYDVSVSGNTVTVKRSLYADGDKSGDDVTYKIFVNSSDEALTKSLTCISKSISETGRTSTPNNSAAS